MNKSFETSQQRQMSQNITEQSGSGFVMKDKKDKNCDDSSLYNKRNYIK